MAARLTEEERWEIVKRDLKALDLSQEYILMQLDEKRLPPEPLIALLLKTIAERQKVFVNTKPETETGSQDGGRIVISFFTRND